MQFPVPKNIDLEDKIIGPMTLRQFLYVLVGGTIAYALIKKIGGPGGNNSLALTLAIPVALFSLALAFVKVQERPFADFLSSFFTFLSRPRQRIWQKRKAEQDLIVEDQKHDDTNKVVKKSVSVEKISDLTKILDSEKGGENKEI